LQYSRGSTEIATTPTNLLDRTVTTRRGTTVATGGRSPVTTYADNLTNVKAAVQPLSRSKQAVYGAERANRMMTIYVAPGQDILQATDMIRYTDRASLVHDLRIVSKRDMSEKGVLESFDVEEVEGVD
jgi:hypothetical protein